MTNLRLVLLATTALTVAQLGSTPSHAQTAPLVVAQATPKEELGPDGKPKQPSKEAPKGAPPKAAPPPAAAPPKEAPKAAPPPPPAAPPKEAQRPVPPPTPTPQTQQKGVPSPVATPPAGGKQLPSAPSPTSTPSAPPPAGGGAAAPTRPGGPPPNAAAPAAPNAAPGGQTALPAGAAPLVRHAPPTVTAPLPPPPPPAAALTPIPQGAPPQGARRMEDFRGARQESDQGGRKVFTEPGRVIIVDPSGQSFIRHDEDERFRYGARDIRTEQVGGDTRTIVIRPDGSQIITVVGRDGQLLRRIRRGREGPEIIIIDNSYRDPGAVGGFFVRPAPPVRRLPYDRY